MSASSRPRGDLTVTQQFRSFRRWPLWLGLISVLALTLGLAFGALAGLQGGWQLFAAALASLFLAVSSGIAAFVSRGGRRTELAAWLFIDGLLIFLPAVSASIEGLGFLLASLGVLLVPSVAESAFRERERRRAVYVGSAAAIAALLVDLFSATERIPNPLPASILTFASFAFVGMVVIVLMTQFANYQLRTKLILSFLAVTLIPLGLLTLLTDRGTRSAIESQANEKLFGAASQTAAAIDFFVRSNLSALRVQSQIHAFEDYLELELEDRAGNEIEGEAVDLLVVHQDRDPQFILSYALLDSSGQNVLDTNALNTGLDESRMSYFSEAMASSEPFASQVLVPLSGDVPSIFFSSRVEDETGRPLGVLRAQLDAEILQQIVVQNAGLAGPRSFAVLFDGENIHLAHSAAPETFLQAAGPLSAVEEQRLINQRRLPDLPPEQLTTNLPELDAQLEDSEQDPFFQAEDVATGDLINQVAVAQAETQPWKVAFFQPQDILLAPAEQQARYSVLLAVVIAALVSGVAVVTSNFLSAPIMRLTAAARQVAAGDLDAQAQVESEDEIGLLASTFNAMALRIQSLVTGLEDRVSERTVSLERRAQQLQAAAEVSKSAATIGEVDHLLDEAVNRISDRFGYYHAGVFLISGDGEQAELRAASSEGGRRMLSRGHSLAVGKLGLVGYVTGTGNWRMAADVRADQIHYVNPELPDTRSELALPLTVGERIIGALDVQSREPGAFDEQDIVALQTMADQLAISIQNARLLSEQTALAAQRRRAIDVYRELSQQLSYDQILADVTRLLRATFGYERATLALVEGNDLVIRGASAGSQERLPRLGRAVPLGQGVLGLSAAQQSPIVHEPDDRAGQPLVDPILGELGPTLAVPLISRGQALGAIALENPPGVSFDEEDVSLAELLASQISVSIENARLFEETQYSLRQVDALYRRQTAEAWEVLVNARRTQGRENLAEFNMEGVSMEAYADEQPFGTEISLRGEIIGRMDLLPSQPEGLSDEDRAILEEITQEVAAHLEQLRLVEEIQRRATQLETAAEIARVATGLLDLDALLERSVSLIRESFGFYHVAIYLIDERSEIGRLVEASGAGVQQLKGSPPQFELQSRTVLGFASRTGEYYIAHDTGTDPYYVPHPALPDSRSELGIPLRIGELIIGAMDVHDTARYAFSEDDITALETLADQLAVAIENARLFRDALSRATREQAVLDITGKIRASSDIDSMMRTAVQEIRAALGARRGSIRLAASPGELRSGDGTQEGEAGEGSEPSGNGREEMG